MLSHYPSTARCLHRLKLRRSRVACDGRRGCSHIDGLLAEVRAWVWRAGIIGCEYCKGVAAWANRHFVLLDQPDEARAKHGICGGEKGGAEGLVGGERYRDLIGERGRHFGGIGRDGAEEEVVVVGHGSVVEEGGVVGGAGVFEEDVFSYTVLIRCTLRMCQSPLNREMGSMVTVAYPLSIDSACRRRSPGIGSMQCQIPQGTSCPVLHALGNGPHV